MIIRSQNKYRITDDLKLHIGIHEYKATDNTYEIRTSSGDAIGEYSTMEKAVKVLDMICRAYAAIEIKKVGMNIADDLVEGLEDMLFGVFEMPQDSEVIT